MLRAIIWFLLLFTTARATHYECAPNPVKCVCIIENISYHPGDQITFPTGYQHYHIKASRSPKKALSQVTVFDEDLYEAMHRPSTVEMTSTELKELVLPPELLLGNFAENSLASVNVSTGQSYKITHLDLKSNRFANVDFVRSLVNLEALHLEHNHIKIISGLVLSPLTKLKYLYLKYNWLTTIPWNDLPRSLIHLDCSNCHIEVAEFTNITLPSLEYLNLQHNGLRTFNVTALVQAAPILKEAHLYNYRFTSAQMRAVEAELTSHNVSFIESPSWHRMCSHGDESEDDIGNCVSRIEEAGTGKAIVLTAVVICAAGLFLYIAVVVFRYMNR